jgi:hypothetical protein
MASELPIWTTAKTVWRDSVHSLSAYPLPWIGGILAYALVEFLASSPSIKSLTENAGILTGGWFLGCATMVAPALTLVPAALLTHRLIVQGSGEGLFETIARRDRVLRYAGLEAIVLLTFMVPIGAAGILFGPENENFSWIVVFGILIAILLWFYSVMRLAAVYPAIALDASVDHLRSALTATRGRAWRIFLISIVTIAPFLPFVGLFLGIEISRAEEDSKFLWGVPAYVTVALMALPWVVLMSNVYLALVAAMGGGRPQE